jgi:hypothetical protein
MPSFTAQSGQVSKLSPRCCDQRNGDRCLLKYRLSAMSEINRLTLIIIDNQHRNCLFLPSPTPVSPIPHRNLRLPRYPKCMYGISNQLTSRQLNLGLFGNRPIQFQFRNHAASPPPTPAPTPPTPTTADPSLMPLPSQLQILPSGKNHVSHPIHPSPPPSPHPTFATVGVWLNMTIIPLPLHLLFFHLHNLRLHLHPSSPCRLLNFLQVRHAR